MAITAGDLSKPGSLLPMAAVSVASLIVIVAMSYFALRESRIADPATHRGRIVPITIVVMASIFLVIGWNMG